MSQRPDSGSLTPPVSDRDHYQGLLQAAVVLVEYGDFQCPHCGAAYSIIYQLQQQFGEQLCFVFRHFPLSDIHPQAAKAAEAAEVAAEQGRFWQMHQILFERQSVLTNGFLVEYANQLGLNMPRFLWNYSEHVYANRVQADLSGGIASGVSETPTFFINGSRHLEPWSFDSLQSAIATIIQSQSL